MSQQGDVFVRRVLKGDPAPASIGDAVQYFRQRAGSGRGAGKLAGVSPATLNRAQDGRSKPATVDKIMAAFRGIRSAPTKMGDAGVILPVSSLEQKRLDRERDVWGHQLQLAEGTLAASHQVWVATGDADAALRTFIGGVQEPWYRANLAVGTNNPDLKWVDGTPPDGWDEDAVVLDSDYGVTIG